MTFFKRSSLKLTNFFNAILRYPLSFIFFIFSTYLILRMNHTYTQSFLGNELLASVLGGILASLAQAIFERFFIHKRIFRLVLYLGAILITGCYYYIFLKGHWDHYYLISIRTSAFIVASIVAYVWLPSFKRNLSFEQVFTVALKAFFTSLLFSIVLLLGFYSIVATYAFLITEIDFVLFGDIAAVIFSLFAPLYFLSYFPFYETNDDKLKADQIVALSIPKLLEILITYIVIPLLSIYTLILIMYIFPNLTGQFWSDNLLEPLLIGYAIVGIITLFVAHNINNRLTKYFKSYFPKLLLFISAFQTVASILRIQQFGVTHGRYYVIMFGLFSIISSALYSFFENKKWLVPVLFIGLTYLSIIPPIDAITVGVHSQKNRLESILSANNMLKENDIVQDVVIDKTDREDIIDSMRYLYEMDALDTLDWLPANFSNSDQQFKNLFGFSQYAWENDDESDEIDDYSYTSLSLEDYVILSLDVSGSDLFTIVPFSSENISPDSNEENLTQPIKLNDTDYLLKVTTSNDLFNLSILDEKEDPLITLDLSFLLEASYEYRDTTSDLPIEALTFSKENSLLKLTTVIKQIEIQDHDSFTGQLYLFIDLK
ncbi:DUF4153 domain-containing protein [Marinilactibacillus kalidii]|uniref:DUF4153 domain-containing protein n=1 Tax=Marinilactibacillus kalidii TaxID=2820274 RepID=UPI001ABDBD19|nr:DUF4153 domain-containing protein [Marinilactibacillus kalidii]